MAENQDYLRRIQPVDTAREDAFYKKTVNDRQPTVSASENVHHTHDTQTSFDDLKNTLEGLREGSQLSTELQALVSTLIASIVTETLPKNPQQNTSTDKQGSGGVAAVESTGPANNKGAIRRMQQVMGTESRLLQQVMDYLQLSSPARKDEHIQNMGLEYNNLPPTLTGYMEKREALLEKVQAHLDGQMDKEALRQAAQPLARYVDTALMIIDNSLALELAREIHEQHR